MRRFRTVVQIEHARSAVIGEPAGANEMSPDGATAKAWHLLILRAGSSPHQLRLTGDELNIQWQKGWKLLRETFREEDKAPQLGASLAFYTNQGRPHK